MGNRRQAQHHIMSIRLTQAFLNFRGRLLNQNNPSANCIRESYQKLQMREFSISRLAAEMHMDRKTLENRFSEYALPIQLHSGRLPTPHMDDIAARIHHLREEEGMKVGFKRAAITINLEPKH
jgi:hypothetical protein